jgi:hypothetical protein
VCNIEIMDKNEGIELETEIWPNLSQNSKPVLLNVSLGFCIQFDRCSDISFLS